MVIVCFTFNFIQNQNKVISIASTLEILIDDNVVTSMFNNSQ